MFSFFCWLASEYYDTLLEHSSTENLLLLKDSTLTNTNFKLHLGYKIHSLISNLLRRKIVKTNWTVRPVRSKLPTALLGLEKVV